MSSLVRVLLDEGVPEKLRLSFSGAFEVETVRYRGWAGLKNGELLRAAAPVFDALVTVDKRLHYQQHVVSHDIAVIVLDSLGTKYSDLLPLIPEVEAVLRTAKPGSVTVVAG